MSCKDTAGPSPVGAGLQPTCRGWGCWGSSGSSEISGPGQALGGYPKRGKQAEDLRLPGMAGATVDNFVPKWTRFLLKSIDFRLLISYICGLGLARIF